MNTIRVAVVQAFAPSSLADGLVRAEQLVAEAAAKGATIIAFPETWLPGYPVWLDVCRDVALWDHAPVKKVFRRLAENSVSVPGDATRFLSDIASRHHVTIVIGVSERVDEGPGRGTLYNSILTFTADGSLANHHRKLMPTYTERMVWGAGDADGLRSVDAGAAKVGALVCWEHWMPLARQAMHEAGEDIHVALWPTAHEMLQLSSRHYAFEGRCFVLVAGTVMRTSNLPAELEVHPDKVRGEFVMHGGSAIIGPNGAYVAGPVYDSEVTLIADLDLDQVREERMTLDVSGHYHRPELISLNLRNNTRR